MATADESPLESWYESSIGEPSTSGEVYGYWMFALGILAGFVGIALVVLSSGSGEAVRGAGIALAAFGLVMLLVGQIIRLPLERTATMLSIGGAVVSMLGVAWFVVAFNAGNWGSAFAHSESLIIGLYGVGILVMAVGSVVTPLVTRPREEQAAAEARAGKAEAERDAARVEVTRHEKQDEQQAAAVADSREEQTAAESRAGEAEAKRDAAMSEITRLEDQDARTAAAVAGGASDDEADSQSRFELYTDAGDEFRWRLRHNNGNIIADGSEGYSSRQKAMQGLDAVKRDVVEATVLDLDEMDGDETAEDVTMRDEDEQ
jgi:uncharacterized protein YegP (UPF0339 family)